MNTINLCIIATNKYTQFLPKLLASVDEYFMKKSNVCVTVFTDKTREVQSLLKEIGFRHVFEKRVILVPHRPWPYTTLHRFHFFKDNYRLMGNSDYYFYIDTDTIIKDHITEDILSGSMAVRHCGFMNKRGSYETNPMSQAFVGDNEGQYYFGGGFWGFGGAEFWHCVNHCSKMIDEDAQIGITPVWNDESVLNRYLIDFPPTTILSPSYHYPEGNIERYKKMWAPQDYPCRILLLDKLHEEIRS